MFLKFQSSYYYSWDILERYSERRIYISFSLEHYARVYCIKKNVILNQMAKKKLQQRLMEYFESTILLKI